MNFIDIFFIGVGLSMDAFAVSVCKGLNMRKVNHIQTFIISLFFGGFQALMPIIGWMLGTGFRKYIDGIDGWVAFGLLELIGLSMIWETFHDEEDGKDEKKDQLNLSELFVMAIATSIDALAVGVTFSLLIKNKIRVFTSVAEIGIITFIISYCGVMIGNHFGIKYKKKATIAGGMILMILGIKILLESYGFFK